MNSNTDSVEDKEKNYFAELKKLVEEKKFSELFTKAQGYCIACGHDQPQDMEFHHVGAEANSKIVVSLCRNCHGRISRKQRTSWPRGWAFKNKPEMVKTALLYRGYADLLRLISDQMLGKMAW